MANVDVIPTAQNLPDGACFTSWQDVVDAFATAMRVTLPSDYGQIIISELEPDPADRDKIWFEVDASGRVLNIRSWDSTAPGSWERVEPEPYYFVDVGVANSLEISTGDAISTLSDLTGRLLIVKAAAASTSTSPTLEVDSTAPTTITKYGASPLEAGDIAAGMLCIFLYDGTQYQLLNPTDIPQSTTVAQFAYQQPAGTAPVAIAAGDTTIPLSNTVVAQSWATLGGGGAVVLDPGTYQITATLAIEDSGGSGGTCQLVILDGTTDLNWNDFVINNSDDSLEAVAMAVITVADGDTASITAKIYISPGGAAQYGVCAGGTRGQRPASLTIVRYP